VREGVARLGQQHHGAAVRQRGHQFPIGRSRIQRDRNRACAQSTEETDEKVRTMQQQRNPIPRPHAADEQPRRLGIHQPVEFRPAPAGRVGVDHRRPLGAARGGGTDQLVQAAALVQR